MTYTLEVLPDMPVLVATMSSEYSLSKDGASAQTETVGILEKSEIPLFLILDLSRVTFSLDDVIAGANMGARGQEPVFRHPKVRETLFIARDGITKFAAKGMSSPVFGRLNIQVFDTIEEALAYVRSKI